MARLSLAEIAEEIDCGDPESDGFDAMLSDLGVTIHELLAAATPGVERIYAMSGITGLPTDTPEALASTWVQGAIAGIAWARKKERVSWRA